GQELIPGRRRHCMPAGGLGSNKLGLKKAPTLHVENAGAPCSSAQLRCDLEDDSVAIRAPDVGRTEEIALFVEYHVTERVLAVAAPGEDVERVVRPSTVRQCQLVNRSGVVSAIAVGSGVEIPRCIQVEVAEGSGNTPAR